VQLGSAHKQFGGSENAVKSDINVTPLVDVCLVLLIIFMVVVPMLATGIEVDLPETRNPEQMPEGDRQLNVSMKADGAVFINANWVPAENVKAVLAEIYASPGGTEKNVVIKGDRSLKYRQVRSLMQTINEAGFTGVGLVSEKAGAKTEG
jgi:biopolymer transport protein TolR